MKTRLLFLDLALLTLVSVWAVWFVAFIGDPVGPRNYCRLRVGMTLDEAEAVFGLPREERIRQHSVLPSELWGAPLEWKGLSGHESTGGGGNWNRAVWMGRDYFVEVWLDRHERVVRASLWEVRYPVTI